jgi:hypothetical protein
VVGVGKKFHEPVLLKPIDQNLNILTGAESCARDLGHRLWTVALEKLKSGAARTWKSRMRICGLQAIRQTVDFNQQCLKRFLQ